MNIRQAKLMLKLADYLHDFKEPKAGEPDRDHKAHEESQKLKWMTVPCRLLASSEG